MHFKEKREPFVSLLLFVAHHYESHHPIVQLVKLAYVSAHVGCLLFDLFVFAVPFLANQFGRLDELEESKVEGEELERDKFGGVREESLGEVDNGRGGKDCWRRGGECFVQFRQ